MTKKSTLRKLLRCFLMQRQNIPTAPLPIYMMPELRKAHQANDKAVMLADGFDHKTITENECVAELMK